MACAEYKRVANVSDTDESAFNASVLKDGNSCIGTYSEQCASVCKDPTRTPTACYNCLTNAKLCVKGGTADSPLACCPYVREATACNRCINKKGSAAACMKPGGLTGGALIGVIVGCIAGAIVLVVVIVWIVKNRSNSLAHQDLIDEARSTDSKKRVNSSQLQTLANLHVDTDVLRQVEQQLV